MFTNVVARLSQREGEYSAYQTQSARNETIQNSFYLVSVHGRSRNHSQQSRSNLDIMEVHFRMGGQKFLRVRHRISVTAAPHQFNELLQP